MIFHYVCVYHFYYIYLIVSLLSCVIIVTQSISNIKYWCTLYVIKCITINFKNAFDFSTVGCLTCFNNLYFGNLAGGRVQAVSEVTSTPCKPDSPDELELAYPETFPVCVTTRAMSAKRNAEGKPPSNQSEMPYFYGPRWYELHRVWKDVSISITFNTSAKARSYFVTYVRMWYQMKHYQM